MVVEDQPLNQELIREILERAGMEVECAGNGREAVSAMADHGESLDVILMDLQMPVMDGYDATRLIREREGMTGRTPIIAMTAHGLEDELESCWKAGMDGHLAKPVNVEELFHSLLRWVPLTPRAGVLSAAEATPHADEELPESLPGLDLADGLDRLLGNTDLYRRLIIDFCRERRGITQEMKEVLATGELQRLRAMAHALAGVAGNLAITGVCVTATDLEAACSRGETNVAENLLRTLEGRLAEVTSSAGFLEKKRAWGTGVTSKASPYPAIMSLLQELSTLAAEHNLRSLKMVGRLVKLLAGTGYAPVAARLAESLECLDFGAAYRHLETLISLLEGQKKAEAEVETTQP